jgi:SAM-dependent methyltransferase
LLKDSQCRFYCAPTPESGLNERAPHSLIQFVCPIDRQPLKPGCLDLTCERCGTVFPVINGVPVLINDANSVFQVSDYTQGNSYDGASGYAGSLDKTAGWRRAYRGFVRRLSEAEVLGSDVKAIDHILSRDPNAKILVVGSGERAYPGNVTYTDVTLACGVSCICDAHDLPFEDGSFDAVFAESVLEHVCDPQRCVAEFARVLTSHGYVMAVTPFLQSVHMGAYDFTRFTYLGHRRLFRQFDDIASGMCGGPAYSVIHLMRNLATTLTDRPTIRSLFRLIAILLSYPMRHADRFLSRHESAYNTACAFYFFGQKRAVAIRDRDIIGMFRGL